MATPASAVNLTAVFNNNANLSPTGGLNFPSDLGSSSAFPYWMSFSFYQYTPVTFNNNVNLTDLGTIRLPLPNNMVDQQDVRFNATEMGLAIGMSMNQVGSSNPIGGAAAALGGSVVGKLANKFGGADVANLGKYPLQALGATLNPFMTVMFEAPSFKKHSFAWQLTPVSPGETQILNSIANTFKANQLPGTATGGLLLTYPSLVLIVVSNNDPNNFTYIFKPAVIESFSVNWTPAGQPSFFGSTKGPTMAEIRISLMEVEFWLNSDFTGTTVNNITIEQLQNTITSGVKSILNSFLNIGSSPTTFAGGQ